MKFEELPEFQKDLKALLKKYRTLNDDLNVVKKVLEVLPDENKITFIELYHKIDKDNEDRKRINKYFGCWP